MTTSPRGKHSTRLLEVARRSVRDGTRGSIYDCEMYAACMLICRRMRNYFRGASVTFTGYIETLKIAARGARASPAVAQPHIHPIRADDCSVSEKSRDCQWNPYKIESGEIGNKSKELTE